MGRPCAASTEFDAKNHWLIDRGDGRPSVNLVVLSFVHPLKLLNKTTDAQTLNGVPRGMTPEVVNYFKSRNIRVMLSIGGITYVNAWNQALAAEPRRSSVSTPPRWPSALGVGIEIDYEENTSPNLAGLQAFINAYRSHASVRRHRANHAARLTIDLAAGDRWLIAIDRKGDAPTGCDTAHAGAGLRQRDGAGPATASASRRHANWQEHVDGKPQYSPPIRRWRRRSSPAACTSSTGNRAAPECTNFSTSLQKSHGDFVQTVAPNGAGHHDRHARVTCSGPPSVRARARSARRRRIRCEGGVGVGATTYGIPIPMPPLRQVLIRFATVNHPSTCPTQIVCAGEFVGSQCRGRCRSDPAVSTM